MLFKPELVREILKRHKRMTRRIVRDEDDCRRPPLEHGYGDIDLVVRGKRVLWEVGQTYAVQPGRGKPTVWWTLDSFGDVAIFPGKVGAGGANVNYAREKGFQPARIEIAAIRQEHLQDISDMDLLMEGIEFTLVGEGAKELRRNSFINLWDRLNNHKGHRWADNPAVWVLTFELVS